MTDTTLAHADSLELLAMFYSAAEEGTYMQMAQNAADEFGKMLDSQEQKS